jgi:hypothetical protein
VLWVTPFEVVYGYAPPPMAPFQPDAMRVIAMDRQLRDRDIFLTEICSRLVQAQSLMKQQHVKRHWALELAVGDWAWLWLNHHAAVSVRETGPSKLAPKFFRPYQLVERIGPVAYWLKLPTRAHIQDVFHIEFLRKFEGQAPDSVPPLPPIVRGKVVPQLDQVLCARPTASFWELSVHWADQPASMASWEALEQFKESYPEFQLFQQGGVMSWTSTTASNIGAGPRRQ